MSKTCKNKKLGKWIQFSWHTTPDCKRGKIWKYEQGFFRNFKRYRVQHWFLTFYCFSGYQLPDQSLPRVTHGPKEPGERYQRWASSTRRSFTSGNRLPQAVLQFIQRVSQLGFWFKILCLPGVCELPGGFGFFTALGNYPDPQHAFKIHKDCEKC